ncbi:MAG: hypothetical protein DRP01_03695 [Archaeoglobales archaeon]|nr:MAG: hypothetical protein DRP01_03695 [Archaeoglobales archaeon]
MPVKPGDVTRFLRDYPSYNIMLDTVQFDDEDISASIRFAISEFNAITPISSYASDAPDKFPNEWLLLLGAASHLMSSEAFLQIRNQVTYNDGNVAIGVDDKWQAYTNLKNDLKKDWKTTAQKFKQQKNMEQCYGGLSSGYRWIRTGWR